MGGGCSGLSLSADGACLDDDTEAAASTQAAESISATAKAQAAASAAPAEAPAPVAEIVEPPAAPADPAEALTPTVKEKIATPAQASTIARKKAPAALTLSDAIRLALKTSPTIGIATASRLESESGIDQARAGKRPTFDITTATGESIGGSYKTNKTYNFDYFARNNGTGSWRSDAKLTAAWTLWDFGAVDSDIERAMKSRDAAALREAAAAEDVAFSAAQLYIRIQQQREQLQLAEENLSALRGIASLIGQSLAGGNATQADEKRVAGRVLDAESSRADMQYELKVATERFIRLTGIDPGPLRPAPALDPSMPRNAAEAVAEAFRKNPMIVANQAVANAARAEMAALKSGQMPKLAAEADWGTKTYVGQTRKTELDARAMLSLTYKLADGGLSSARYEQAAARLTQAQLRDVDAREGLEADIRTLYHQYASSRAKREGLVESVKATSNARTLYQEQFGGGKRSLLELLEVQSAYYQSASNAITNAADLRLASYMILKHTGRLSSAALAK